jgi:transcription initiation factor TFIIB
MDVDDPAWACLTEARHFAASDCVAACDYCGSADVRLIDGNFECVACHSIVNRFIDSSAEWRFYGAEDTRGQDPTRCSPPTNGLLHTLGCGATRVSAWRGGAFSSAGGAENGMRTIQKYQMWNALTYRQRTLCGVFDVLSVSASQYGIPSCILEESKAMYKRMADARITRGETREALVASSLYVACKINHVPRSVKEIAAMFNVRVSAVTKACRIFQQTVPDLDLCCSAASDFVARFCCKLDMDVPSTAATRRVVARADEIGLLCESTPPSVVSGAIFFVSAERGLGLSKKDVGVACLISPVTVLKCYKRMHEYREQLLAAPADDVCVSAADP